MPFSESQLETWAGQGSVTQSAATYQTIKNVLASSDSPYHERSFEIFLQGSYGNHTNIYADSDVDIVINLQSAFNHNISELAESAQTAFHTDYPNVDYGYVSFKTEVLDW